MKKDVALTIIARIYSEKIISPNMRFNKFYARAPFKYALFSLYFMGFFPIFSLYFHYTLPTILREIPSLS
jgi:hypothetical protein